MYKIITDWLTWKRDEREVVCKVHATFPKLEEAIEEKMSWKPLSPPV